MQNLWKANEALDRQPKCQDEYWRSKRDNELGMVKAGLFWGDSSVKMHRK